MKFGQMTFLKVLCLLPFLLPAFVGCGGSGGRMAISGDVTLKGKPLEEGVIEFVSDTGKSGATISKGKYEILAMQGLLPGTYKVLITAGDGKTPADSPDGLPGPTGANIVSKDLIPPEYNTKSKQEITVKSSPPNKFDFPIP